MAGEGECERGGGMWEGEGDVGRGRGCGKGRGMWEGEGDVAGEGGC